MNAADCPHCGKYDRPIVTDQRGPRCPSCGYLYDPPDPVTMHVDADQLRRWYGIPENAHNIHP